MKMWIRYCLGSGFARRLPQEERNHLIFEEVTQSLGLMNDSNRYADSIFYQKWSRVTHLSEIDREVIRLLYHQAIVSGMDRQEVIEVLSDFRSNNR